MSNPFQGLGEPFSSITRELDFPASVDAYATPDDLSRVVDLTWIDITVKRWFADGKPLNLRVRALSFDEQEQVDRASLIKVDGQIVKSEARFASATLKACCVVPQLNEAQAKAMREHNPEIIGAIVKLVWSVLSVLDQEAIDAMVDAAIPDPIGAAGSAELHGDGADESSESFTIGESFSVERARAADMAEA